MRTRQKHFRLMLGCGSIALAAAISATLLADQSTPQAPAPTASTPAAPQTPARELVTTAPQSGEDAGESALLTANTASILGHAAAMAPATVGQAKGVGDLFTGLWSGAREVLRTLSYYEMKNRAYGICPMQVNSRTARAARRTGAVRAPCTAGTARGADKTSSTSQERSRDSR